MHYFNISVISTLFTRGFIYIYIYCDERPEASSASPWKHVRNNCPSSSRADQSELQLITRRLHKPHKPCRRERDFSTRPSINSPYHFSHSVPACRPFSPTFNHPKRPALLCRSAKGGGGKIIFGGATHKD